MEFLLVLLFIDLLPLFIEAIFSVWRFCYLCMPIDLLLHFEEGLGELHPLVPSYCTSQIQVNKVTSKDVGQCKTSSVGTNTVNTTAPSHTDNNLKYPEECSNDNENDMDSLVGSVVECCSEADKPQLVVTVSSVCRQYDGTAVCSSAVPEQQSDVQVSPQVAVPKKLTSQVAPPAVREVCPPAEKETSQPTIQEIQYQCNTRYQDGCDDSESDDEEEEEEDRKSMVPHDDFPCDYQGLEEMMILQGALLCSSDTKIDQAGKNEETVMVEESRMMMGVNSSFTSCVGSTSTGDEVKNDNNEESSTTIVSSNSAYTPSADDVVDQIHQQIQEDTSDNQNGMLPDPMSPND